MTRTLLAEALHLACDHVAEREGTCPYDLYDVEARDCLRECDDDMARCWRIYFMEMAKEEGE